MKSVYPLAFMAVIFMVITLPGAAIAQCMCSAGIPAVPVTQLVTIDTSTASRSIITFNQWHDTSTNTVHEGLACMTIQDTISVVSSTGALNTSSSGVSNAIFATTVSVMLSGPGNVDSTQLASKAYGPYNFGPSGDPTDYVLMGPDTMFNKEVNTVKPNNPAPYEGFGTVSDTLTFGGGSFSSAGNNFTYTIQSKYWGSMRITYYWCPSIALATAITDFTATPNGKYINLQWTNANEQNNTNYEIQISTDGQNFTGFGETESNPASAGTAAKYQYQYNLDQAPVGGKLYFRIKETDATGKVTYSEILVVSPGTADAAPVSYQVYPNPAANSLVFQFNTQQTGRYLLELVSTAGQVVQQKAVTLTGTSQIRMDLNPQPAKGLYFLRTTDMTRNQNYVSKIFIQ
jgi:hypothetical protein